MPGGLEVPVRKLLVPIIALAATAAGIVPVGIAGAGGTPVVPDLSVELLSNVEPLRFGLEINDTVATCDAASFAVAAVQVQKYLSSDIIATVTPISVTEDPANPNRATMVLPSNTPGGDLLVAATCTDKETVEADGGILFANSAITKVVTGAAPADAAFTVHLDCSTASEAGSSAAGWSGSGVGAQFIGPTFAVDLPFTAAGGTSYVYADSGGLCTVTEPVTGGATTVTISNDIDTTPAPASYAATVTNDFAPVVEPTFTG